MASFYVIISMYYLFQLLFIVSLWENNSPKSTANSKEKRILWMENQYPTWSDYKGKPKNNGMVAETSTIIEISFGVKNGVVFTKVNCAFLPLNSWVHDKQKSDYILKHELLHFDITELYARKLRKRFASEIKTEKDYPKINKIYREIISEWQNKQQQYDGETNHSINKDAQILWNEEIANELELMLDYK